MSTNVSRQAAQQASMHQMTTYHFAKIAWLQDHESLLTPTTADCLQIFTSMQKCLADLLTDLGVSCLAGTSFGQRPVAQKEHFHVYAHMSLMKQWNICCVCEEASSHSNIVSLKLNCPGMLVLFPGSSLRRMRCRLCMKPFYKHASAQQLATYTCMFTSL